MIINPTSSLRETEANQKPDEKRLKGGEQPIPASINARTLSDEDISPQAQLVQHMIDAWQSKEGTVSGKVLTELESPETTDPAGTTEKTQAATTTAATPPDNPTVRASVVDSAKVAGNTNAAQAVPVDIMQTLGQNAQRMATAVDRGSVQLPSPSPEQPASRFDSFREPVQPMPAAEGVRQNNSPSVVMDFLSPQAAQAAVATRDIVTSAVSVQSSPSQPMSPPAPVIDKSPIPVNIPELAGVVSDTCFEFDAIPSLVEGRFESFAA